MSPQRSCGNTTKYECDPKNLTGTFPRPNGEITERSFSNLHPSSTIQSEYKTHSHVYLQKSHAQTASVFLKHMRIK